MARDRRRTLFQSFDPARFRDDNARAMGVSLPTLERDAEEDIALARCELLGAILFGHQVVVPAGSVADSPAFVQLLSEVLEPSRQQRARIARLNQGTPYFPFTVGLEPRFEDKTNGRSGYDAFVEEYLGNYSPDRIDTRVIKALSEKIGRKPEETMVLVGNAYLSGRIEDLESTAPEYAVHVRWVLEQFSHRVVRPAPDSYSKTNQFRNAPATLYSQAIEFCCREVEQQNIAYSGIDDIRRASAEITQKLAQENRPEEGNERGVWYKHGTFFGQHWSVVRNWLDRRIHDMFIAGYGVSVPSYFTQKLPGDPASASSALAYLQALSGKSGLSPPPSDLMDRLALTVPWAAVWDILADPDVQREVNVLQDALVARRDADEKLGQDAAEAPAPGSREALIESDRLRARSDTVREALDRYVAFINKGQTQLALDAEAGMVTGIVTEPPVDPRVRKAGDIAGGAAVGTAAGVIVSVVYPPSAAFAIPAGAALGAGVNVASGVAWEGMKAGYGKLLGVVRRKPDEPIVPALQELEQARLSVWTTSTDWGQVD